MRVQKRMCPTCIYRPFNADMLPRLLKQIADPHMPGHFKSFRICHYSDIACCRGFWEAHKDDFDAGQLAQRLGIVEIVDHGECGICNGTAAPEAQEATRRLLGLKGKHVHPRCAERAAWRLRKAAEKKAARRTKRGNDGKDSRAEKA